MTASPARRVYFDHSATTGVLPEVFNAMTPFFLDKFGNSSSLHSFGREARAALEDSRKQVANLLNAARRRLYSPLVGRSPTIWQ